MAIKNLIKRGFGYSPGSVKFIPTHGFSISTAAIIAITDEGVAFFNLTESKDSLFNLTEKDDARINLTESGDALL